ncbi:MAG: hypothetical protein AAF530_22715 [Pseudomonadota bacterium]
MAEWLVAQAQSLVLVAIFLTGCVLTAVCKTGFLSVPSASIKLVRRYSLLLLGCSLLTVLWACLVTGERFVEIGIPLLFLFAARQFLIARLQDRDAQRNGTSPTVAIATLPPSQELDLTS